MYYIVEGELYVRDGDVYRNVGISAKDKVVTRRELESVTVINGTKTLNEVSGIPYTLDEIIGKFNVSESNPVKLACEPEIEETTAVKRGRPPKK